MSRSVVAGLGEGLQPFRILPVAAISMKRIQRVQNLALSCVFLAASRVRSKPDKTGSLFSTRGWTKILLLIAGLLGGLCSPTIKAVEPCAIICPADMVAECTTPNGAVVQFSDPLLKGDCAKGTTIQCSPASGSFFPLGTSVVNCTATDALGKEVAACKFLVTVNCQSEPCVLNCPANLAADCSTPNGAPVTFPDPSLSGNCPSGTVVKCDPPSGSFFALGLTVVNCTAADAKGNVVATCKFLVTVNCQSEPCVLNCPANLVADCTTPNGAPVTFPDPSLSGNCPSGTVVKCDPPSGSFFALGLTVVNCTAADAKGNIVATCKFSVTVSDKCSGSLPCLTFISPPDLSVACQKPEGAVVNYPDPTGRNQCTGAPLAWTCYPPRGLFPLGTTLVKCWGPILESGESAYCEFRVTVGGNCPPPSSCLVLDCPRDMEVHCDGPRGAIVHYTFSAKNPCTQDIKTYCTPPSGSLFPSGTSYVTCTAVGNGQTQHCRFAVTVTGDCTPRLVLTHVPKEGFSPAEVTLSWPANAKGVVLQTAGILGPETGWSDWQAPVIHAGGVNQTTIAPGILGSQFFRLTQVLTPRPIFTKPARTIVDENRSFTRQIVFKFHEGTRVRMNGGIVQFDPAALSARDRILMHRVGLSEGQVAADLASIRTLLRDLPGATFERLHPDISELQMNEDKRNGEFASGEELADLNLYGVLNWSGANAALASQLIDRLNALASIEIAYASPRVALADIAPRTDINLLANQGYLSRAPMGINAVYGWTFPGGKGEDARIIDVEGNWHLDHEDFPERGAFYAGGIPFADPEGRAINHGTAVLGEMVSAENGFGSTGIVPNAEYGVESYISVHLGAIPGVPSAILNAATQLRQGDVILVEAHSPGPSSGTLCNTNCGNCEQFEFVPQEFFAADWDAIQNVTALGIIVVEAAGNGQMNLDNPVYNSRFSRTPPTGVRGRTRAIMVGASNGNGDLRTACFSNFGSGVDANGWGMNVATLGYGDRRANGDDARQWYTVGFSGTSSASPIVAGAVLSIQGARRARGLAPLDPDEMRLLLQNTGWPQYSNESRPVGRQPNLRQAYRTFMEQDADLLGQAVPERLHPGETTTVTLLFRNTGHTTWRQADHHALSTQNPLNNTVWTGLDRFPLPRAEVAPNEQVEFRVPITAPSEPGAYNFQWRMVQDDVEWFGEMTQNQVIVVGDAPGFQPLGIGTRLSGELAVASNSDGRLEVFAHGLNNQLLHIQQTSPGGSYSAWEPLSDNSIFINGDAFSVVRNSDNRLEVFGFTLDSRYAHLWQTAPGATRRSSWSAVERFDGIFHDQTFSAEPASAINSDGRLELFGATTHGDLAHCYHILAVDLRVWSIWYGLGGTPVGVLSVINSFDGRIHVFARWADSSIRHIAQSSPGGGWTGWEQLGAAGVTSDPVAALNANGSFEVLARSSGGSVLRMGQDPMGRWNESWSVLGGTVNRKIAIGQNVDGSLEAFATTTGGSLERASQSGANGTWGGWEPLGGSGIASDVAVGRNPDGRLEIFVRGADQGLWRRKQIRAGVWQ